MYSSEQFAQDWRFRIDKDFLTSSGRPFDYTSDGRQAWGDEDLRIPFPPNQAKHGPRSAAISDDGRYIAISAKFDIHVVDLANPDIDHPHVLHGHISEVDCIAFRPGRPTQLVSAAMNSYAGTARTDVQIIYWDLTTYSPGRHGSPTAIANLARQTANTVIADLKSDPDSLPLGARDQKEFADAIEEPLRKLVISKVVAQDHKLFGRLLCSFQSIPFSPSGEEMFYMPGNRPKSNGDDDWELRLYSWDTLKDTLVLSGHRDAIMWAGFNHDQTLIGTAAWDKTFRIWDAKDGSIRHVWQTTGQNWTGGFSPNGKYFAGTCGNGDNLYVYNLADGSNHMTYPAGRDWCRSLCWHPNQPLIALGGTGLGKLFLIDVDKKDTVQHRTLSLEATKFPDGYRNRGFGVSNLTATDVHFVDGGRKLIFFTTGDGSAEAYDLSRGQKMRFARSGTMNDPGDDSNTNTGSGGGLEFYEDHKNRKILIATLDRDAVRLWTVPMTLSADG